MIKIWGMFVFVLWCKSAYASGYVDPCSEFSSQESDDYWQAVSRCTKCNALPNCGYCLSTLQCVEGAKSGAFNGVSCPSWTYEEDHCPDVPICDEYVDCGSCAKNVDCAWCASDNACITISAAFTTDCRGLVFEPPCPSNFVSGNYTKL